MGNSLWLGGKCVCFDTSKCNIAAYSLILRTCFNIILVSSVFSEMANQHISCNICRICAILIPNSTKRNPVKKHECSSPMYKTKIEEFFSIQVLPSDPTYFCHTCFVYMYTTSKRNNSCLRFVKRLWSVSCGDNCEECENIQSLQNGGRPSKQVFSLLQSDLKCGKNYHLLSEDRDLTCPTCCSYFSPEVVMLSCGHMVCKGCMYICDKHVKCARCCKISLVENTTNVAESLVYNVSVNCTNCHKKGKACELYTHKCVKMRQSLTQMTVGQLTSSQNISSDEARLAAQKVCNTWLPHLADSGVFRAKTASGKVSLTLKSFFNKCV